MKAMTFDEFINENVEKSGHREFRAFVEKYGSTRPIFNHTWHEMLTEFNDKFKRTHPGFTVTCDSCGSKQVYVDISVGFSSVSGAWGSVDLICSDCHQSVEIFEP